uniref:Uncharacterized protein n=1 Tax=Sphenodon punctatus TaxID=8508 RepID=A0A8D0H9Z7_SPHPU
HSPSISPPPSTISSLPHPTRSNLFSPVSPRYSEVSFLELDKFLEDVRNGIYPLMNFATVRPHTLPRALSQPPEDLQKAKTPTPEPFDVETRKVSA